MRNNETQATPKKVWSSPKIVPVGAIEDQTGFGDGNLRDNQGDANPSYKPLTISNSSDSTVVLPEGE